TTTRRRFAHSSASTWPRPQARPPRRSSRLSIRPASHASRPRSVPSRSSRSKSVNIAVVKTSRRQRARFVAVCAALVAAAASPVAAESPAVLSLERGWTLQSSAKVRDGGAVLSSAAYEPKGWYAVTVPSTVVAAQVGAGEFPDPYFGMNLRKLPGMTYPIGLNSFSNVPMDKDSPYARSWWYRTEFALPAEWKERTLWLRL